MNLIGYQFEIDGELLSNCIHVHFGPLCQYGRHHDGHRQSSYLLAELFRAYPTVFLDDGWERISIFISLLGLG